MRLLPLLLLLACNTGGGSLGDDDNGRVPTPECQPCADGLVRETDPCAAQLTACNNIDLMLDGRIACFRQDAACYSDALQRSASCHDDCNDDEQANVERCTAVCFDDRFPCDEAALRRTDTCFEACNDPLSCNLCQAIGEDDHDACLATFSDCAEDCKKRYRR